MKLISIYIGPQQILHHNWEARDAEDADADGVRLDVQELLHHHGNGTPHHVLLPSR